MNERIKELIEQCTEDYPIKPRGPWFNKEKFAKLIVKECADVCQHVTNNGMFDGNQQYASAYCRDQIKRYFGVKE